MGKENTVLEVRLYNTLSRSIEVFEPIDSDAVRLYCCGPTVYNYPHIGNMRSYIFEDLLVRTLRYAGHRVQHVMNITDVGHLVSDADDGEDKMAVAARREGKKSEEIAQYYTDVFFDHSEKLRITRPTIVCKATDHIQQMIELIQRLEAKGVAYKAAGNVYFDVATFEDYGQLAKLDLEQLQAGARIEVDENKRNPMDFALWFTQSKFNDQELQWDSPWGRGYPGWHIECSAMAMHYLGETFDIHCGGIDHIPVHHTNEIAQSEGATGKQFSRVWMHGGFLVMNKDKMSKSSGGFITVDTLIEKGFDPVAYRLFCLSGRYRNELAWSWEALGNAANSLKKLKSAVLDLRKECSSALSPSDFWNQASDEALALKSAFETECLNDLAIPNALAVLHQTIGNKTIAVAERLFLLEQFDAILGLGVADWHEVAVPAEVLSLAQQRDEARASKNWQEADTLRDKITALGYTIEDSVEGTKVKPTS